jgi:hypothetical protein
LYTSLSAVGLGFEPLLITKLSAMVQHEEPLLITLPPIIEMGMMI